MMTARTLIAAAVALTLSGCGALFSGGTDELEAYAQEVLQRPGQALEPLPDFRQPQVYLYQSGSAQAKDPFVLFYQSRELDTPSAAQQLTPEQEREIVHRVKEDLEEHELDALRMVGSLSFRNVLWGLVKDPDNVIHWVKVGNYMGRNIGKILRITEELIELRELVQDSRGLWEERSASLGLIEDEG